MLLKSLAGLFERYPGAKAALSTPYKVCGFFKYK
jgi:hypothetical protein